MQKADYSQLDQRYEGLVNIFAYLVKERVYGPVDRMARATDLDTVRLAVYEALRYASTELKRGVKIYVPSEGEVQDFLRAVEKRIGLAREIAIKALTRGLQMEVSSSGGEK
ncbi:hypothetical protein N186_03650 [Thermofilum adornatum]|uniref:Uncharacterized protein n=1 Tax=Thermofilum adornatum TaxID=1365176 RepID=S6A5H6_9CREN|nr:hypothetical protein [Thermofilum adornatum]AGT35092.1 hypothetical protein N186_03650 [Thermofilum adornatum]